MVRGSRHKYSKPVVLIVCEGRETEINYFKGLRKDINLTTFRIQPITSENKNATGIINYTKSYCERKDINSSIRDVVFCVFDRDLNSNNELEKAVKLAKEYNFKIIFSNPCIEYWFLSHFEYVFNNCEYSEINQKLNKYISYQKNMENIYFELKLHEKDASSNCKRIEIIHKNNSVNLISRESNPSSNIFEIIEEVKNMN